MQCCPFQSWKGSSQPEALYRSAPKLIPACSAGVTLYIPGNMWSQPCTSAISSSQSPDTTDCCQNAAILVWADRILSPEQAAQGPGSPRRTRPSLTTTRAPSRTSATTTPSPLWRSSTTSSLPRTMQSSWTIQSYDPVLIPEKGVLIAQHPTPDLFSSHRSSVSGITLCVSMVVWLSVLSVIFAESSLKTVFKTCSSCLQDFFNSPNKLQEKSNRFSKL